MLTVKKRIINAFIKLLDENGYDKTTTKRIAEVAEVNETTIFKNFKNKANILAEIVDQYVNDAKLIEQELNIYEDPDKDLINFSKAYQKFAGKYQSIILNQFTDATINQSIQLVSICYKNKLSKYLLAMKDKHLISADVNVELQSMTFLWLNFGYLLTNSKYDNTHLKISLEDFLKYSIGGFIKSIQ